MKKFALIDFVLLLGISGLMIAFAPDTLSLLILIAMVLIMMAGMIFGIIPTLTYADGFRNGIKNIDRSMETQTNGSWMAIIDKDRFFEHRVLDRLFGEYQEKVRSQRQTKQIVADVEDYINEDILFYRSWQGVLAQIPGTLTGLGILGTFLGLITGINEVSVASVDATIESIQLLLNGIELAFYTSIAGVVLSIVYNFINKITWSIMNREMALFLNKFHKQVIPTVEEQIRYRDRNEFQMILERLDRLPKKGGFAGESRDEDTALKDQKLLSQIMTAMKNGEFVVYLQPRYNIMTGSAIGAEALVRWQRDKLGIVSPDSFIPVLEKNGYITKLDQYVWETVVKLIRSWIDEGRRVLPISVNVTKTDILALDVVETFDGMLRKYKVPPRYFEIDFGENVFEETGAEAIRTAERLRAKGLRVAYDGFDGDFCSLSPDGDRLQVDVLKLDLRQVNNSQKIPDILETARKMNYNLIVEGIENMEQVNLLRKHGCTEGQGYYFSKPLAVQDYEEKCILN